MFLVTFLCHGLCLVNGTFKECAQRQLPYIDVNDQTTFMHYVNMICKAQTYAEYKLYANELEHICRKNK